MKKVFICSKCGKAYLNDETGIRFCPDDGGTLISTGFDETQWSEMSEEAQNNTVNAIIHPTNRNQEIADALKSAGSALGNAAKMTGEKLKNSLQAEASSENRSSDSKISSFAFQPYKNVGGKLCEISNALCLLGCIISVVLGLIIISNNPFSYGYSSDLSTASVICGVLVIAVGCFISWLTSVFMNAMGVIVIKLGDIEKNTGAK